MLFVSPKIETNPYYHQVYQNFIRDFKGIPRVISGGQLQEVPYDSDVTGFLPDAEYEYVMTHLAMHVLSFSGATTCPLSSI